MKAKPCKECGSEWHSRFNCPYKMRKGLTTTKPMSRIGKVGKATAAAVAAWKRTQNPNHQGYYICYMCGRWVEYLEAEHVQSKVRHPDRRTDPTNLKPTCNPCNERKRSNDN